MIWQKGSGNESFYLLCRGYVCLYMLLWIKTVIIQLNLRITIKILSIEYECNEIFQKVHIICTHTYIKMYMYVHQKIIILLLIFSQWTLPHFLAWFPLFLLPSWKRLIQRRESEFLDALFATTGPALNIAKTFCSSPYSIPINPLMFKKSEFLWE